MLNRNRTNPRPPLAPLNQKDKMNIRRLRPCHALLTLALAAGAHAQTVTVNTVEDYVDFPAPQQVAQLPGPDGFVSLAEAIIAANNTPGPQTIAFAIPRDQWWLLDNVALLQQENLFLLTDDGTTIDFSTQTDFTGDTNPDGNEVAIWGTHPGNLGIPSIWVMADHCVIKGLGNVYQRGNAVRLQGNFNRVIGCVTDGGLYSAVEITGGFGGPSPHGNIIGGTEPGEGNVLTAGGSGISSGGPADHNVVIGNVLKGPSSGIVVAGVPQSNLIAADNRIGGPTPAERNLIAGSGLYGEEGFPSGTQVHIEDADGTIVEGNYIGTNADGSAPDPHQRGPGGVVVVAARGTVIRNNLISGLWVPGINHYAGETFGTAIGLVGGAVDTVIQGNLIGTDASGASRVPTFSGILANFFPGRGSPGATLIGGVGPGEANTIAYTDTVGVSLFYQSASITISGNSIHDNGLQGIDLQSFEGGGITPNDPGDGDTGANELQNFPELVLAQASQTGATVVGSLNSHAGREYSIEFFASPSCDPSGYGQGSRFLGSVDVSTDVQGNTSFEAHLASGVEPGEAITATATDLSTGDTSEFSACILAEKACAADFNGDGAANTLDVLAFLNAWAATDASADFDGNGVIDSRDVLAFLNAWTAGC
ncbi:MAG: hypothetical protein IPJ41_14820 [Phycisphaerales bacterium]|nr:hypothetical protein [Phycisphaerales bacterium]